MNISGFAVYHCWSSCYEFASKTFYSPVFLLHFNFLCYVRICCMAEISVDHSKMCLPIQCLSGENRIIKTHNQIQYIWLYKNWVNLNQGVVELFLHHKLYFLEGLYVAIAMEGPIHKIWTVCYILLVCIMHIVHPSISYIRNKVLYVQVI